MVRLVTPPSGKLAVTVTHFEMMARPTRAPRPKPLDRLLLTRVIDPTTSFYRYLYRAVGERVLWASRLQLPDDALTALLHSEQTEIYVLYRGGVPAGFAEIARLDAETVELVHFGMVPEFEGRGLGSYLLDAVIDIAWSREPKRLIVQTCTLDSPRAMQMYQRAGFVAIGQERKLEDDPRATGLLPKTAAAHIPINP